MIKVVAGACSQNRIKYKIMIIGGKYEVVFEQCCLLSVVKHRPIKVKIKHFSKKKVCFVLRTHLVQGA